MKNFFHPQICLLLLLVFTNPAKADIGEPNALIPIINFVLLQSSVKHYPPETSFTSIPTETNVAYPEYLGSVIGPVFGNKITRLSDFPTVRVNFPYPKTPSWNSDGTLLMLTNRLINGKTYEPIATSAWWGDDEKKWSASNPHLYYAMEHGEDVVGEDGINDHSFVKRDVTSTLETGIRPTKERLITFSGAEYEEVLIGKYEGNIDHQDKYVVFAALRAGENHLTALVYDIEEKSIITQKEMTEISWVDNNGGQVFDWISVSPSGRFILLNWKKDPDNPLSDYTASIDQYDIELNFIRELSDQGQHGDIGVAGNGNDMYVQFGFGGERRGIWGYDLETGASTKLLPDKYNGGHVSCRNYQRPGWCYVSTTQEGYREVFALKLDDSGTVNRFVQTHTTGGNSHGGVSPDGTKIIFDSDWGGATAGGNRYEAFVVEVEQK